jgi:glutaredoxin
MALKDRIKSVAAKSASRVGKGLAAGFNRADEVGGEVRDYILERTDSPVVKRLSERLARIRGGKDSKLFDEQVKAAQAAYIAQATAAAPPPTAADLEAGASSGLGDPNVAAQIYGRESCPWTGRSITVFNELRVDYDFIDLDDADNALFEGRLIPETKQNTVPWIFLRGQFIGGFNALSEIARLGHLPLRTMPLDQQAASRELTKVSIAKRDNTDEVAPGELTAEEPLSAD